LSCGLLVYGQISRYGVKDLFSLYSVLSAAGLFLLFFIKVTAPVILRLLKCQESKNKALPTAAVPVNYFQFIYQKNYKTTG